MNINLTMIGRLSDCALLSYRTPAASVAHLLPDGLELVTRGPWAFWNVVACRVDAMRPRLPKPVPQTVSDPPKALGVTYHHVAYRLLVQAMTDRAEVQKGLYFLRSDADAPVLGTAGNWMTDFNFHAADITLNPGQPGQDYALNVSSRDGRGDVDLRLDPTPAMLAPDSCFPTLQDAQEFLKYQPYALAVTPGNGTAEARQLRIAEVQRDEAAWVETAVTLRHAKFTFFDQLGQTELIRPELATRVAPMDYVWKLGKTADLLAQPRSVSERTPQNGETVGAVRFA